MYTWYILTLHICVEEIKKMKKEKTATIICIILCMLMIGTSTTTVGAININKVKTIEQNNHDSQIYVIIGRVIVDIEYWERGIHIEGFTPIKILRFGGEFGVQIIAHELDADAIESGIGTGADMYGVDYEPCPVDVRITSEHQSFTFGQYQIQTIHIPGHTNGSIAAYLDTPDGRILFGQDIHGPYLPQWGGDPPQAKISLQKLIDLKADILCEGHFGIYKPGDKVEQYIRRYMESL